MAVAVAADVAAVAEVGAEVVVGAVVAVGTMAVDSDPQAMATAEPPATNASRLKNARRYGLPPRSLSVLSIVTLSHRQSRIGFDLLSGINT